MTVTLPIYNYYYYLTVRLMNLAPSPHPHVKIPPLLGWAECHLIRTQLSLYLAVIRAVALCSGALLSALHTWGGAPFAKIFFQFFFKTTFFGAGGGNWNNLCFQETIWKDMKSLLRRTSLSRKGFLSSQSLGYCLRRAYLNSVAMFMRSPHCSCEPHIHSQFFFLVSFVFSPPL